jgi:hypothetical protein
MGATRRGDGGDRLKEPGGGVVAANVAGTFAVGKGVKLVAVRCRQVFGQFDLVPICFEIAIRSDVLAYVHAQC